MRLNNEIGVYASYEHEQLAKLIKEYDPTLDLVFIPLDQREMDETFPFAILHNVEGKEPYVVRKVRQQDMRADLLMAWLYMTDGTKTNVSDWLDAQQLAREKVKEAAVAEAAEAAKDFTTAVIGGKNYFRHNGRTIS